MVSLCESQMFCVKDEEINFKQISKTEITQYCSKFRYLCPHSIFPPYPKAAEKKLRVVLL